MAKTSSRGRPRRTQAPPAPAPAAGSSRQSSAPPPPVADNHEHVRAPFLRAEHVGNNATLKPLAGTVRTLNGNYGVQLVIDVMLRGERFSWGIGTSTPNLRLLVEALVDNPGKAIPVTTMISANQRPYIAIKHSDQPRQSEQDEIPF